MATTAQIFVNIFVTQRSQISLRNPQSRSAEILRSRNWIRSWYLATYLQKKLHAFSARGMMYVFVLSIREILLPRFFDVLLLLQSMIEKKKLRFGSLWSFLMPSFWLLKALTP